MQITDKIVTIAVLFNVLFSASSQTLDQIYELQNPYHAKFQTDNNLVEGSPEFIKLGALSDRFEYCQSYGINTVIGMARHVIVMENAGSPESKHSAMTYMAKQRNLAYPFDPAQIEETATNRIDQLAIELGWKHPGNTDAHFNKLSSIFWEQCLNLPIKPFEDEWRDED